MAVSLKLSQMNIAFKTKRVILFIAEYLRDAREKFVKESVFMQSRDQFEEYMRVMEN